MPLEQPVKDNRGEYDEEGEEFLPFVELGVADVDLVRSDAAIEEDGEGKTAMTGFN